MFLDNCQDHRDGISENGRNVRVLVVFESNIELSLIIIIIFN